MFGVEVQTRLRGAWCISRRCSIYLLCSGGVRSSNRSNEFLNQSAKFTEEGEQEDDENLNEIEVNQSRFKLPLHRRSFG